MESPVFWNGLTKKITRGFTSIRLLISMEGFSWHIGMYLHQLALGIQLSCFAFFSWSKIPLLLAMTSAIQTLKNNRCCELQLSRDMKKNQNDSDGNSWVSVIILGNRSSRVLEFFAKILDKFKWCFVLLLEGVSSPFLWKDICKSE